MQVEAVLVRPRSVPFPRLRLSVVALFAAALPILTTWLIFWYLFPAASIAQLMPAFTNDEIAYWHQILTFKVAGFGGGYYTYEEQPAPWSISRFSVHGPVFPMLFGLIARVIGWTPASGPFVNMAMLAVALLAAVRIGRLGVRAMLGLALLASTSWWVLILLPTTMQETFHQSIGIVLGALLGRLALGRSAHTGWLLGAVLVFLALESVIRPTWVVLLGPALLLALRPRSWLARVLLLATSVPAIGASWLLWRYISAPVTTGVGQKVAELTAGLGDLLSWPLTNLIVHLDMLRTAPQDLVPGNGRFMFHVHYEAIGVCLVILGLWLWRMARRSLGREDDTSADLLHLCNVGGILLMTMTLGEIGSGLPTSRAITPHLLLTLVMLLVTRSHRAIVAGVIVTNLLFLGPGIEYYRAYREPAVTVDRAQLEQFRQQIASRIVFDPTRNPWCNTLDVTYFDYTTQLTTIEGGIGLTYLPIEHDVRVPLKARYIYVKPDYADQLKQGTRLNRLIGNLYENLDAPCRSG